MEIYFEILQFTLRIIHGNKKYNDTINFIRFIYF